MRRTHPIVRYRRPSTVNAASSASADIWGAAPLEVHRTPRRGYGSGAKKKKENKTHRPPSAGRVVSENVYPTSGDTYVSVSARSS